MSADVKVGHDASVSVLLPHAIAVNGPVQLEENGL